MRALFSLLCLIASATAGATDWQVDPAASTLAFRGSAQGEAFDGRFKQFQARIRFDPNALGNSRFEVDIATGSADTQNAERDETLLGSEFFDSTAQPSARYVAERFEALDARRFRALGTLTLRGISKPVPLEFEWKPGTNGAELIGNASLDRLDFNVGSGEWADPEMIAPQVDVTTRLVLTPAG